MERKFPHLSSPIQIGNVVFRNRMCSAPMGGTDITNEGAIGPAPKPSMNCAPREARQP